MKLNIFVKYRGEKRPCFGLFKASFKACLRRYPEKAVLRVFLPRFSGSGLYGSELKINISSVYQ
ncbi:hypothetical protein JCM6294_3871 [Bacteroides pyogenes DSM 20611 = JCM 6294]|uniref:Uncharacterized protein n=1 Tax=Bacteroides pyogenes DSM 20611 = JCM 6294 TaxID=1121100 RepID=W4PLI2_9BACE|nr:hypothetical protein JCM6294_3871 [Bacteroides pyogenes DSM 20611 = JCM 6294]